MFLDLNEKKAFFFDSNGNPEPKEVSNLVKKIQNQSKSINQKINFDSNVGVRHQNGNTECGMYCLFFIINILEMNLKFDDFKKKSNLITDEKMEQFREQYFNKL